MLTDSFLRKHTYLRVSITDKCNLRCRYCMPPEGVAFLPHDEILRNEEFIQLIRIFVGLGVKKIRFTGGEPLVRKGFLDIVAGARELAPDVELCLTTNGILLENCLDDLKKYNVKKLNISLDTLSQDRYRAITRRDYFPQVMNSIERAISMDYFNIKINAVLFEETLREIDDFLDYFKDKNISLRFIERMPFTEEDEFQNFLSSDRLVDELQKRGALDRDEKTDTRVAQMYVMKYRNKYSLRIGIIPPMTHKFCSSCNRLRLTSDGQLRTCLYATEEYNLKKLLRNGDARESIVEVVQNAVQSKLEGHTLDCYSKDSGCSSLSEIRSMSKIGG